MLLIMDTSSVCFWIYSTWLFVIQRLDWQNEKGFVFQVTVRDRPQNTTNLSELLWRKLTKTKILDVKTPIETLTHLSYEGYYRNFLA